MATYCTAADVKRILMNDFSFGAGTVPTSTEVTTAIEGAEAEIETRTRHAWQTKTVTNEFYNIPNIRYRTGYGRPVTTTGIPIYLKHRAIKSFDTEEGDKIEIWDGSSYVDWLTTKTEGRANDFWLDETQGILYLRYYFPYFSEKAIRLTYRYGESTVPNDIRDACARLAAIDFITNDDMSNMLNETGDPTRLSYDARINNMNRRINRILRNRVEPSTIR